MARPLSLVLLFLLLAVATFLRLHEIDRHGLWIDEANSVLIAERDLAGVIEGLRNDANPPVYYLVLHYWVEVFGDSERAVRGLSVVCGVILVGLLYLAGAAWRGPPAGLFAAAVYALHPLQIYNAQTARMYTLLPLIALLSLWMLSRAAARGGRMRWAGYALVTALAPLTHNWGLFLFPAGWVLLLVRGRNTQLPARARFTQLPAFVAAQVAAALPYLLWLPVILKQAEFARTNWIARVMAGVPPILKVPMSIDSFVIGGGIPDYFAYFGIGTNASQVWIARALFAVLLFPAIRAAVHALAGRGTDAGEEGGEKPAREPVLSDAISLSYLMVPLLAAWGASLFIPLYIAGRYDVIAFPAFALLAGSGFALLRPRPAQGVAVALLIGLALSAGRPYYLAEPRRDDVRTAHYLAENAREQDLVVFAGPRRSTVEYSLRRLGTAFSLESFPRELADHMGLFEPAALLENPAQLDRDARAIADRARQPGPEQPTLWVVDYPAGPLNVHLYRQLGDFAPDRTRTREDLRVFCFRPPLNE